MMLESIEFIIESLFSNPVFDIRTYVLTCSKQGHPCPETRGDSSGMSPNLGADQRLSWSTFSNVNDIEKTYVQ